jgi:hypothetical protein
MDLPIANHLEAYFIRKEGEAGVEKFMRVSIADETAPPF